MALSTTMLRAARTRPRTRPLGTTLGAIGLVLFLFVPFASAAEPARRPTDTLLRLVPADSAVVVTVEGLREHANAFFKSRLATELAQLPAVRDWFASEKYRQLERSRERIEKLLGVNLSVVRDELVGDAMILALRLNPAAPADASQARGLLLARARDPALLQRVIHALNTTQLESGELAKVVEQRRNGTPYFVREFPAAANRPAEACVAYPDGTFAFSNSEALIKSVIDRVARQKDAKVGGTAGPGGEVSLADLPRLKAIQAKLPERAIVRLFIDPRQLTPLLASAPRPNIPGDARIIPMLERYLGAIEYAGAALTSNDESIMIHGVQTLNPSLLDPWLRRWIADKRQIEPTLANVPPTAVILGSGHLHALALLEALSQLVPEKYQAKLVNRESMLTGLLLGQDLRTRILPLVGPGIIAYLDMPSGPNEHAEPTDSPIGSRAATAGSALPVVVAISLGGNSEPGDSLSAPAPLPTALAAIDNALRTVLAMAAMDDKRADGGCRLTTRAVAGTTLTTLDRSIPFAYAIDRVHNRLVVSTSASAVARYLEHVAKPKGDSPFSKFRAAAFPEAVTYACVDFVKLDQLASKHRDQLIKSLAVTQKRSPEDVERDLAQALALARLFRAGFITARFEADATTMYQSMGLIRHQRTEK